MQIYRRLFVLNITPFQQQVGEDETGQLESAAAPPRSDGIEPEETVSTEGQTPQTEHEAQESGSPPPREQQEVADLWTISLLNSDAAENKNLRRHQGGVKGPKAAVLRI